MEKWSCIDGRAEIAVSVRGVSSPQHALGLSELQRAGLILRFQSDVRGTFVYDCAYLLTHAQGSYLSCSAFLFPSCVQMEWDMVNLAKSLCSLLQGDAIHFKFDKQNWMYRYKLSPSASIPPGSVKHFFACPVETLINPMGIFSIRVAFNHLSHVSYPWLETKPSHLTK